MVSPGEHVSATLKREFGEEALSMEGLDEVERSNIGELFKSGGLEVSKRGNCFRSLYSALLRAFYVQSHLPRNSSQVTTSFSRLEVRAY